VLLRGGFDIPQHGIDVDRFAEVTAAVFAKSLHLDLRYTIYE
jgi:hypothetical protein